MDNHVYFHEPSKKYLLALGFRTWACLALELEEVRLDGQASHQDHDVGSVLKESVDLHANV